MQSEKEFLEYNEDADEIVMDEKTGKPIKAVYTTLNGIPRKYPVEYYFNELTQLPTWDD